eukprot:4283115-Heterocapsa_arctica.AAC.1
MQCYDGERTSSSKSRLHCGKRLGVRLARYEKRATEQERVGTAGEISVDKLETLCTAVEPRPSKPR